MSNSIIPSFLPPPYDFTTEEYYETEEEEEDEWLRVHDIIYGTITGRKIRFAIHSQPGAKMQLP